MVVALSNPTSSHPRDSFYHVLAHLCCLFHPNHTCHSRSGHGGECNFVKRATQLAAQWESPPPDVDLSSVTDPNASSAHLVDSVWCLIRPFIPINCQLFGGNDWKIARSYPDGGGGYAEIWVCKGNDGSTAVVKSFRRHSSSNHLPIFLRFFKEALVCSTLNGTNDEDFVPFLGIFSSPDHPLALLFGFMSNQNLGEYLRSNQEANRLELLLQIAQGLRKMHTRGLIHANIKIENILVGGDKRAHIGGLGAACAQSSTQTVDVDRFFHGAAPEVANPQANDSGVSTASDVYAFGVLVWMVFAGKVPFWDEGVIAGVHSMITGLRPARPVHPELSDNVWDLIEGCWAVDVAERMTIAKVIGILEGEVNAG